MLNKQQKINRYQNFVKSNTFGQHTYTTLFTFRKNCDYVFETNILYSKLTQQNFSNSEYSTLDILRIKQQIHLDIISKISVLTESFFVLVDSLSYSYKDVSQNMISYEFGKIHSIIENIHANPVKYDMRLVLGLYDISQMRFLSKQQTIALQKVYDETQKMAISKLRSIANFYNEFHLVYLKSKHGLTYYSGQLPISGRTDDFLESLLICMDRKERFDKNQEFLNYCISEEKKEGIFFNLLSFVKFNEILQSRINIVLNDLQNLIRYICDNHLTYAINCGECYLPFKKENDKTRFNFSSDIFTSEFTENDFNDMFKMISAEMNLDHPPLSIPSKTNAAINKLLNDRGIANIKLT